MQPIDCPCHEKYKPTRHNWYVDHVVLAKYMKVSIFRGYNVHPTLLALKLLSQAHTKRRFKCSIKSE